MLICDSYDSILCGLDSESPELDMIEFINSLPPRHAVLFNRDLVTEVGYRLLCETKLKTSFVFSVEKNAAGFSKDVHGQLNISQHGDKYHNVKYRLSENSVQIFNSFLI